MRRRVIAVTTTTVATLTVLGWQPVAAAPADENTDLAEAQFETYLATNTALIPLDVTCAPLRDAPATGPMICYALISDRQIVAALAELEAPGVYRFISINKVEPTGAHTPGDVTSQPGAVSADTAVADMIRRVTSPDSRLVAMVLQANPDIASVDSVTYFEPTGTIEICVTTTAANDDVRNAIAFAVTEVLAGLWAESQPLRDPTATVQPRLEVTVDGTLYSSAFGMMVAIADGTMTFADWLELTGAGGSPSPGRLGDRLDVKVWSAVDKVWSLTA